MGLKKNTARSETAAVVLRLSAVSRDKPRVLRALEVLQILQKAEKRGVVQVSTLR